MPEEAKYEVIMMGKHEKVVGWKGELWATIVKISDGKTIKYEVICDSSNSADLPDLPASKMYENKMEALSYAMEMERSKAKWKQTKKDGS
jgi:hypothetical protein